MYYKITSLVALDDYILLLGFSNGEYKKFDLKPLMEKYSVFKDFPVTTGGKTGSAENGTGTNAWFVGFAPYEKPEIAVVVRFALFSQVSTVDHTPSFSF